MAKLFKSVPAQQTPAYHMPAHSSTETPRISTNSNATTLYETASGENPPEPKPHISRNKMVRNDFGVWVPEPLQTGNSDHGPWIPPKPKVEDNHWWCCVLM